MFTKMLFINVNNVIYKIGLKLKQFFVADGFNLAMSELILEKAYGGQPSNIRYEYQASSSSLNVTNVCIAGSNI